MTRPYDIDWEKPETIPEWAERVFGRVTWQDRLERIPGDFGEPSSIGANLKVYEEVRGDKELHELENPDNIF